MVVLRLYDNCGDTFMNGAQSILGTLTSCGVSVCFANPGTTELGFVVALDSVPEMRSVLTLHENVATGAADGYGRIIRQPACTLLHLGPGLANGIANLHNARRARTPLINLVGQYSSSHRGLDPVLNMDLESLAGSVSSWVHTTADSVHAGRDAAGAWQAATALAGSVATLIVPTDCQAGDGFIGAVPAARPRRGVPNDRIETVIRCMRERGPTALLLGDAALTSPGLKYAASISANFDCKLFVESMPSVIERGGDLPCPSPIPYWADSAIDTFKQYRSIVLAGALEPISLFESPGLPGQLVGSESEIQILATPDEDILSALAAIAAERTSIEYKTEISNPSLGFAQNGSITPLTLARTIFSTMPENAILSLEAVTNSFGFYTVPQLTPRYTQLGLTGAAIGQGLPVALGAAIAEPERPVLCVEADGSGLYTPQAIWSMAREQANVKIVVCSNRSYKILRVEMERAKLGVSRTAFNLTDLDRPHIDWTRLARSFGVPASTIATSEDLMRSLTRAWKEPGPQLIEAIIDQ
jgi:acetolactate synthase I/II/III large subunit